MNGSEVEVHVNVEHRDILSPQKGVCIHIISFYKLLNLNLHIHVSKYSVCTRLMIDD